MPLVVVGCSSFTTADTPRVSTIRARGNDYSDGGRRSVERLSGKKSLSGLSHDYTAQMIRLPERISLTIIIGRRRL